MIEAIHKEPETNSTSFMDFIYLYHGDFIAQSTHLGPVRFSRCWEGQWRFDCRGRDGDTITVPMKINTDAEFRRSYGLLEYARNHQFMQNFYQKMRRQCYGVFE